MDGSAEGLDPGGMSRRAFLGRGGAAVVGVIVGERVLDALSPAPAAAQEADPAADPIGEGEGGSSTTTTTDVPSANQDEADTRLADAQRRQADATARSTDAQTEINQDNAEAQREENRQNGITDRAHTRAETRELNAKAADLEEDENEWWKPSTWLSLIPVGAAAVVAVVGAPKWITDRNDAKQAKRDEAAKEADARRREDEKAAEARRIEAAKAAEAQREATNKAEIEKVTQVKKDLFSPDQSTRFQASIELGGLADPAYERHWPGVYASVVGVLQQRAPGTDEPFERNVANAFFTLVPPLTTVMERAEDERREDQAERLVVYPSFDELEELAGRPPRALLIAEGVNLGGVTFPEGFELHRVDMDGAVLDGAKASRLFVHASPVQGLSLKGAILDNPLFVSTIGSDIEVDGETRINGGSFHEVDWRNSNIDVATFGERVSIVGTKGLSTEQVARLREKGVEVTEYEAYQSVGDIATGDDPAPEIPPGTSPGDEA